MKRVRISGGLNCKSCGELMQRCAHPEGWKPTLGRAHYRYWDLCRCGRIQNYMAAYVPPEARNANIQPSKSELNKELDRNLKEARESKAQLQKLLSRPKPKKTDAVSKRAARKTRKRNRLNRHIPEMNEILHEGKPNFIPSKADKSAFYASWEWRKLRMRVLKAHGAVCLCCGAGKGDVTVGGAPVRIVVDHIKPLSKFWNLRLDIHNLQVLCDECNMGKGAWDETDHRPGLDKTPDDHVVWGDSWDDFEEQAGKLRLL